MILHIYRPRWFQWAWFVVNQPIGCWVMASTRFQEPLSCPWTCPLRPHGQITMTLYTYRPRQFQWTWFRVNRPSGSRVLASTRFQEPLSCPWAWACPLCPHRQMIIALQTYRPRGFQWTWFGVNWPSGCWVVASPSFLPDERPASQPAEQMDRQTGGEHSSVHFFLWKGWVKTMFPVTMSIMELTQD